MLLEVDKHVLNELYKKYKNDIKEDATTEEILSYLINNNEWSNELLDVIILGNICTYCDYNNITLEYKPYKKEELTEAESLLIDLFKSKNAQDQTKRCIDNDLKVVTLTNYTNIALDAKFKYWINNIILLIDAENRKLLNLADAEGTYNRINRKTLNNLMRINELKRLLEKIDIKY